MAYIDKVNRLTNADITECRSKAQIAVALALSIITGVQRNGLGEVVVLRHTGACTMLGPFVTPEIVVGSTLACWPVFIHVGESGRRNL